MRDLEVTLSALAVFPAQLASYFDSFPAHRRGFRPSSWDGIPSERLSAIEQVCHVRDIEIEGYQVRLRRTLSEDNPVLPDLPGESMAVARNYAESDPATVLRDFSAARVATVAAIRGFTAAQFDRPATFEGRATTLRGLVHLLCSHDFQHLAGMQWLLAKLPAD